MNTMNEYEQLVAKYISYKRAQGLRESTLGDLSGRLKMIGRECGITSVFDIEAKAIAGWFAQIAEPETEGGKSKRSAKTRLLIWKYGHGFMAWLVMRGDIPDNPIDDAPRPRNMKRDVRRKRRAFDIPELSNLFFVARLRPLAEYGKMRLIGSRNKAVWDANPLTVDNIEEYAEHCRECLARNPKELRRKEIDGRKWELIYKTLLLTGLRWGELRSLEVRDVLIGDNARIELSADLSKNGTDAVIPVNDELKAELSSWIDERKLSGQDKLFIMPDNGMKRFNYDARVAGIAVKDERGRGIDIHSLRRTFGTMLVRANVNVKVTQTAMRHADSRMTLDIYASCEASEVANALELLPSFVAKPNVFKSKGSSAVSVSVSNVRGPKMVKKSSFVGRYEMVTLEGVDGSKRERRMLVVQGSYEEMCRFYEAVKDSMENAVNASTMKDGFMDKNDLPVAATEDDMLNWRTDPMEVAAYEKAKASAKHEGLLRFAATESRFSYEGDPWSWVTAVESAIKATGIAVEPEALKV